MIKEFIALFFPNICISCNGSILGSEKIICIGCLADLPKTNNHQFSEINLPHRLTGKVSVKYCFSYLKMVKKSKVQSILYSIKYQGRKEAASFFGNLYGKEISNIFLEEKYDLIVPVPLHKKKHNMRGYNQCEWFAKGLTQSMEIPYVEILERTKNRSSQTIKSRVDRWDSVKDIYRLKKNEEVTGKKVLLVDDVLTTGATVEACCRALLNNGATEVSVVTLAIAQ